MHILTKIKSSIASKLPIAFINRKSRNYYLYIPIIKIPYFIRDLLPNSDFDYLCLEYQLQKLISACGFNVSTIQLLNDNKTNKQIQLNLVLDNTNTWIYDNSGFLTGSKFLNNGETWFPLYLALKANNKL